MAKVGKGTSHPHPGHSKNPHFSKSGKKLGGGGKHHAPKPYNPLEPLNPRQLTRQAKHTMRAIYRPGFVQLNREQRRVRAISQKQKLDNRYYLKWLNQQAASLDAHSAAANAHLEAQQAAIAHDTTQGYMDLHDHLQQQASAQTGRVSDPAQSYAFDNQAANQRQQELVGNARERTSEAIRSAGDSATMANASNFAMQAAAEANRVAETWQQLGKISDARQQLRLQRGAETAKEVARLLDVEVQKAQIRQQGKISAAELGLKASQLKLDQKKLNADIANMQFDNALDQKKFGLDKKDTLSQIARRANQNRNDNISAKQDARKDAKKINHAVNKTVGEGLGIIQSNPKIRHWAHSNPYKAVRALTKVLGSAIGARAAVDLFATGSLSQQSKQALGQLGYHPPPKWR